MFIFPFVYHVKFIFVISLTDLPNIALRKPVEQSSTYRPYEAKYAVDGNRGTDHIQDKCTNTGDGDKNPWWRVDLQASFVFHHNCQNTQQRNG